MLACCPLAGFLPLTEHGGPAVPKCRRERRSPTMKPLWRDWNDAIGRATFSVEHAGRVVYLAFDEEEIQEIGGQFGLSPAASFASFRNMMRDVIGCSGWPQPNPAKADQFPCYLAHLAAQVVAAFQMHDDGQTSAKAYWRRLREFLGQSPEDTRPQGLESGQHTALWRDLKRWANETNGGRKGLVRLAEKKKDQHYLIAEPLGQCLLRRADLTRLRDLFGNTRRLDQGADLGRKLRELVDEARYSLPGKYFTKHGLQILEDPARSAAAREQIEAEYQRFLANVSSETPVHAAGPPAVAPSAPAAGRDPGAAPLRSAPDTPPLHAKTTVLLEIARGVLSGGLYRRGQGPSTREIKEIGDVLWRCYLRKHRQWSRPPHKPPHDDFLLTTRDDGFGAYAERRRFRAGDDVLLLVPEFSCREWLDDADPTLFAGPRRHYRPSRGADHPGWEPLEGLPSLWLAIRFKASEDLSGVTLCGKWNDAVDTRAMGLRAVGGLTLRRGAWMLGAGPTVRVVGPGPCDHVLVDGVPHPLDASRCVTPGLGAGVHRVRLPGSDSRELRIRVMEPCRASPIESVGWRRVEGGWPSSIAECRRIEAVAGSGTVHGPRLTGDWPPRCNPGPPPVVPEPGDQVANIPDELMALTLAVGLRFAGRPGPAHTRLLAAARAAAARSANPLLRGMLRASSSAVPSRAGRD